MAAGEQQLQTLVGKDAFLHVVLALVRFAYVEQARLRRERAIAANAIDRAVARRRRQPGARVLGQPDSGPALGSDRERLLGGFLGEVEVAEEADQCRKDAAPLLAEDALEANGLVANR
jgi:hypothetical protein